ncbi:alanyl-tRNA editing protein [Clostridium oryzae]|uniref:Alanine--tRNA ligase n=1 Tax=Clostridium oryzae TaxID=1450648 RepID=A0A1V4IKI8_9CLOT|nr:DHHA1 domain-containing protein [Clostridium oryzae]OPJ60379.1 alanine--tRNA ligase [Clostridium oryzae]
MTKKLFYDDVYLKEAEATVLFSGQKNGKNVVLLDETIFYPEGGGQPYDIGTIDDCIVTEVFEEGEDIYHVVDKIPQNEKVLCKIDFKRRFDHMQQHSGEHLLAAAFNKFYNTLSQGFHMGEEYVSLDLSLESISDEQIRKVELEVNKNIYSNLEVSVFFVTPEESEKLPLRKRVTGKENVRIVKMEDADCCACCGTHVKYTGEIGIIKITKTERYKGMTRVYFKCGSRALEEYSSDHSIITEVSRTLSIKETEIMNKVNQQVEEIKNLNKIISEYKKKEAIGEAERLFSNSENNVICMIYENKSFDELENICEELSKKELFIILASKMYKKLLVMNTSAYDINIGSIFKGSIKDFGGKGGGNPKRAQAVFEDESKLQDFIEEKIKPCIK